MRRALIPLMAVFCLTLVSPALSVPSGSKAQDATDTRLSALETQVAVLTREVAGLLTVTPESTGSPVALEIGKRTKTSGCVVNGALPDPACTPGDVLTTDTVAVCTPGYSGTVRAVSTSTRNKVFAEYGIASHQPGQYEVDHLISLELGGSNRIANLWPEAAEPRPGFHEKDRVENYLHQQVCSGKMPIEVAQREIATNWLAVLQSIPSG